MKSVDPADDPFERVEAVELDPHPLLELRALDELEPAAERRGVEHAHAVVELPRSPKRHLGIDGDALRPAPGEAVRLRAAGWIARHRKCPPHMPKLDPR